MDKHIAYSPNAATKRKQATECAAYDCRTEQDIYALQAQTSWPDFKTTFPIAPLIGDIFCDLVGSDSVNKDSDDGSAHSSTEKPEGKP